MINIFSLLFALLSSIFSTLGAYLLKRAALIFSWKYPISFFFILSGVCYVFATILFILALRLDKLSLIYPIAAFQYVFIVLAGVFLFKEKFTKLKALGICFIIVGATLINI